jgi:hypothetical protein
VLKLRLHEAYVFVIYCFFCVLYAPSVLLEGNEMFSFYVFVFKEYRIKAINHSGVLCYILFVHSFCCLAYYRSIIYSKASSPQSAI